MLRRLYDRTMELSESRHAHWVLAAVAFVESSVFPIPPHVILAAMAMARPDRAFYLAFVTTAASVLGGVAGYAIGAVFFETIGEPVLAFYGKLDAFDEMAARFNEYGAWAVLFAGVTPFPYKVITIFSGVTGLDLGVFVVSSIVARGIAFFAIAGLLWWFGPPARAFIERRFGAVATVSVLALFGGFLMVRWL